MPSAAGLREAGLEARLIAPPAAAGDRGRAAPRPHRRRTSTAWRPPRAHGPLRSRHPGRPALVRGRAARGRRASSTRWTASWTASSSGPSARCGPPATTPTPDRAMGFCLFNNVAVAAAHALARGLRAGADRRLRRPSRQRHPGHLLRRPARAVRLLARVPLLPGHGRARRGGGGRRPRLHREPADAAGLRRRRVRARLPRDRGARSAAPSTPSWCWCRAGFDAHAAIPSPAWTSRATASPS